MRFVNYHREFLNAGSEILQALTFFGTREKLNRAGYGEQTEPSTLPRYASPGRLPPVMLTWPDRFHEPSYLKGRGGLPQGTCAICSTSKCFC